MAENSQMAAVLHDVHTIAQKCMKEVPVIILGSGSSVDLGVPGMGGLQQALCSAPLPPNASSELKKEWEDFKVKLSDGDNFEKILSEFEASPDIGNHATTIIQSEIARADWRAILNIARDDSTPLSDMFDYLMRSDRREIHVVTTNYDRIAECAADKAGYRHYAGFTHGYLRQPGVDNEKFIPSRRINCGVVNVWKVHGSVDWFYHPSKPSEVYALPISDGHPGDEWAPAIILPGNLKFQRSLADPFRTIMVEKADRAMTNSKSILCIGCGFNDWHILPKLEKCCQKRETILVILAEKLTENAKDFLRRCKCHRRLALESASEGKCRMFSSEYPDGVEVDEEFWRLSSFMSLVQSTTGE